MMVGKVTNSESLLVQFAQWGNHKRENMLVPYISAEVAMPISLDQEVGQGVIFRDDFKRHIHEISIQTTHELASLVQSIATIILSPLAIIGELCRLGCRSIKASSCLENLSVVPKKIICSLFEIVLYTIKSVDNVVSGAAKAVGFLKWHAGEKMVRLATGSPHTILSNSSETRDIVYRSLGLTLLAAGAVFIPVPSIQMLALPIILGSIYGTLNNQFTVRECPEYYTMGHYYDGTALRGHAIKSNNLLIKPVVTGCYATTMVTKIAGALLSLVGTIPYTSTSFPVSLAAVMIAGTCAVALVAAHLFSTLKRNSIQANLKAYGNLIGLEWNQENREQSWKELAPLRAELVAKKRQELAFDGAKLASFNRQLEGLEKLIQANILRLDIPVRYVASWQANNTRNSVGYLFAGGGTLLIAVTAILLRLFAFKSF